MGFVTKSATKKNFSLNKPYFLFSRILHLLHGLPANRRRQSTSQVVSVNVSTPSTSIRRRPSAEVERGPRKGISQSSDMNQKANNSVRTVLTQRWINPENILSAPLKQNVKPCTQEGKFKNIDTYLIQCAFSLLFQN